jgi:copper transport protein
MVRRLAAFLAFAALVVTIVGGTALPAFAHASLLSTEPSAGGVYDSSPSAITLRFSEPVEVSLGGIRVFDAKTEKRVATGTPEHPNGEGAYVTADLPDLHDGTYVVTWRVISADSHPVEGAFTFQVGPNASVKNAQGLATTLLETSKGSRSVGIVYGIERAIAYAAIALLIGGLAFVVFLWPQGRANRRAAWLVLGGWIAAVLTTVGGIALEGVYGAGLPLSKVFDPTVFGDAVGIRYGHVALVRLVLLACALPLMWMVFGRRDAATTKLPAWWILPAALVAIGLSILPGLAGHAATGIQTGLAIPADAIHVLAMALWLGGLAVLLVAVLPRRDGDELRRVLPRYSTLGLACVVALIVTGAYQAWRQVGSLDALRDTDYGRLLVAKLVVFAVLVAAAAFSRDVVNRRYRTWPDDDDDLADEVGRDDARQSAPVAVGVLASDAGPVPVVVAARATTPDLDDDLDDDRDDDLDDDRDDDLDEPSEEDEQRRLRRSVFVEVVLMVLVLAITAALVNAAPGRTVSTQPVFMTLKSDKLWFDVVVAPGSAGRNDVHVQALPTGGGLTQVKEIQVQLTQPGKDLPPFDVPLQQLGTNHYYAPLFDIPYPGEWQMTIRAKVSATDEVVATGKFSLR